MDRIEKLKHLREEERHEIGWIAHRLGWFLGAESFLLTAAIMSHSDDYQWWYGTAATFALGLFGVVLARRAHLAVNAAQRVLHGWLVLEHQLCPKKDQDAEHSWGYWYRLPRPLHLTGDYRQDLLHSVASKYHLTLPMSVVYAWILVFCLAVIHSASKMPYELTFTVKGLKIVFVGVALLILVLSGIIIEIYFWEDSTSVRVGGDQLRSDNMPSVEATSQRDTQKECR